jgi:hypothetical protein
MGHPLHLAVADEMQQRLDSRFELVRDPACGGNQQLPLFVGRRKARDTRMCCVDLLVLSSGTVRAIVEIEESGFLPTKICGKFLQAALATHFIHDSRGEAAIPYADEVLFIQVLDGSKCLKTGTRKGSQAELIERQIQDMLPLRGITEYRLFFICGKSDKRGLDAFGEAIASALPNLGIQQGKNSTQNCGSAFFKYDMANLCRENQEETDRGN